MFRVEKSGSFFNLENDFNYTTALSTIGGGGTIEEQGYDFVKSAVPGAGAVLDLLGMGPEEWASVEKRAMAGVQHIITHAVSYMKGAMTPSDGLHKADVYIEMELNRFKFFKGRYSTSNSIKSIELQIKSVSEFRDTYRKAALKSFSLGSVTVDSKQLGVRQPSGDPFDYNVLPSRVNVKKYTLKQAVKKHVPTSVKPTKDVGYTTTTDLNQSSSQSPNNKPPKESGSSTIGFLLLGIGFLFKKQIFKFLKL
ncbi:hypothetical protein [Tenacibaculum ovolyticum]|uniref:hypothetical protein n=1 Tax=Tenacibaculum ovolyticum TaxID=104270 RepID=UPI001F3E9C37|nr:hypothetical protein [Tenacibaculum ovolyticum]